MNLKRLVQCVMDELFAESEAMDGTEQEIRSSGWLQEHDESRHGGHFDPETMTCKLRADLGIGDRSDRLDGATGGGRGSAHRSPSSDFAGLREQLENAPTRSQFNGLIDSLRNGGQIDEGIADDIGYMTRAMYDSLNHADDDGFRFTDEMRNNLLAINELYQGLAAAYPQNVQQKAAPQSQTAENNGNPTEEQIWDAAEALAHAYQTNNISHVAAALRQGLNGEVPPEQVNAGADVLGEDNPVIRAIRRNQRQIGGAMHTENPATVRENENEQEIADNRGASFGAIDGRTRSLPQSSCILNGDFENAQVTSSARNMKTRPENLRAQDIDGTYMANLCDRLPNIFSSAFAGNGNKYGRDGNVTIAGIGRMPDREAWKRALSAPDSPIGKELFGRLERWEQENPEHVSTGYVKKLRKAIELMQYETQATSNLAFTEGQQINGHAYDSIFRASNISIEDCRSGSRQFGTSAYQWGVDNAMMEAGKQRYQTRKANGLTSELEDRFARVGLYAAPEYIPPVTAKRDCMTCFACHAVAALRALLNIPAIPGVFEERNKKFVWAQVRTNAFPGAIPLLNKNIAITQMENAPAGSVIMHVSGGGNHVNGQENEHGGHCYSYQKMNDGRWRLLEVYRAYADASCNVQTIANVLTYPTPEKIAHERNRSDRRRRMFNILDSVSDDQIIMAGCGGILITPEIASHCNPEYLVGAVTGRPYEGSIQRQ